MSFHKQFATNPVPFDSKTASVDERNAHVKGLYSLPDHVSSVSAGHTCLSTLTVDDLVAAVAESGSVAVRIGAVQVEAFATRAGTAYRVNGANADANLAARALAEAVRIERLNNA